MDALPVPHPALGEHSPELPDSPDSFLLSGPVLVSRFRSRVGSADASWNG